MARWMGQQNTGLLFVSHVKAIVILKVSCSKHSTGVRFFASLLSLLTFHMKRHRSTQWTSISTLFIKYNIKYYKFLIIGLLTTHDMISGL